MKKSSKKKGKKVTEKKKKNDHRKKDDVAIPFPEKLLDEIEKEFGIEAKEGFLMEWQKLTNEDRKAYLMEIEADKE